MLEDLTSMLRAAGRVRTLSTEATRTVQAFVFDRVRQLIKTSARRHPLGFVLIADPGTSLRYHLWPSWWPVPAGQETGEIHDHIFELNSLIIAGELRQLTYAPTISGAGTHRVFEVDYSPAASGMIETQNSVALEIITDERFKVGTAYRLDAGMVHRVETTQRLAGTIVLPIADQPRAPRVFVESGSVAPPRFERSLLSDEDTQTVLGQLQSALGLC